MDCNKTDCIHYKVCEEWKSLGNDNYINESNGNCDCYSSPYNSSGDCISREALKEAIEQGEGISWDKHGKDDLCVRKKFIDNAPTVEPICPYLSDNEIKQPCLNSPCERPQGECRTCIHRDPEDKKCDCGALERQGCPFPVSDDYFCKFYEKGGAE